MKEETLADFFIIVFFQFIISVLFHWQYQIPIL